MNGGGKPTPVRSVLLGFVPNRGDLFHFTLCTYVLMFYAGIALEILIISLCLNAIALNVSIDYELISLNYQVLALYFKSN